MKKLAALAGQEPAALIGLALTVVVAVVDHYFHLTDGQWQHLVDLAPLASGLLTRFRVTPAVADKVQVALDALAEAEQEASTAADRVAKLRAAFAPVVAAPAPTPAVEPAAPVVDPAPEGVTPAA